MPKPSQSDLDQLAQSLKRAKDLFAKSAGHIGTARAYGYLEMAVERFLEASEPVKRLKVAPAARGEGADG